MTQSTLLTRCPHCDTRFRVTDEQLGIAKGKVRCGSCMEVFNAVEHQQHDATTSKTEQSQPSQANKRFGTDPVDDDLVFEDNPDVDATEGQYAGTRLAFSDDELSDSFRAFDTRTTATFDDESDDDLQNQVDESWAEEMLFDERPISRSKREPQPEPDLTTPSEPEYSLEDAADAPTPFSLDSERREQSTPPADWTEAPEPTPEPQIRADDDDVIHPYHDLGYDPIAVNHRHSDGGLRRIIWSLVVLLLIGGLVAQTTYFQFDRLSAVPELRPFYEKGCELAGCTLKPLIAIDRIQSRKLVVRTDPNDRNALIVDAVIINDAEFEQPFPAIGLTFSNLNGDVVAQSVFAPADYLEGDARKLTMMPPETPVRIAINIRDPGRDAVNYNITFRPNRS